MTKKRRVQLKSKALTNAAIIAAKEAERHMHRLIKFGKQHGFSEAELRRIVASATEGTLLPATLAFKLAEDDPQRN